MSVKKLFEAYRLEHPVKSPICMDIFHIITYVVYQTHMYISPSTMVLEIKISAVPADNTFGKVWHKL